MESVCGEPGKLGVLAPFSLQCCWLCDSKLEPHLSNQRLVWGAAGIVRAILEDPGKRGSPEAVAGPSQEVFLDKVAVSESCWSTEERGCPRRPVPKCQALEGVAQDFPEDLPPESESLIL